jgi:hypothetical protein
VFFCFSFVFGQEVSVDYGFDSVLETQAVIAAEDVKNKQPNVEEIRYPGRLEIGGYYLYQQNAKKHNSAFGEADLFIPLLQNKNTLFFLNVRGLDFYAKSVEGNFGLGLRHIVPKWDCLLGFYTFYDLKRSQLENLFQQITAGLEVKSEKWTFDANGYFPIGNTRKGMGPFNQIELQDGIFPFINIFIVNGQEVALWGFDAEVGYNIWKGLSLFAGGFYFDRKATQRITGPFCRVYWTYDFLDNQKVFFDQLFVHAGYSYDSVRGSRTYAGLGVTWLLGRTKDKKIYEQKLRGRMMDYVRRDFDVITSGGVASTRVNNPDGSPVNVQIVTNDTEFADATTNGANVIAIQGAFEMQDDRILQNVVLTGKDYFFGNGLKIQLSNGGELIQPSGDNVFLRVKENCTIRDLTLTSVSVATALGVDIGVGTFVFDNMITTLSIVELFPSKTSANDSIEITNSTFTGLSNEVIVVTFQSFDPTSNLEMTVKAISNNTFNLVAPELHDELYAIRIDLRPFGLQNRQINLGSIENNVINFDATSSSDCIGIYIQNQMGVNGTASADTKSSIIGGTIKNNTISIQNGNANNRAIFIENFAFDPGIATHFGVSIIQIDEISDNTLSINGATSSFGVLFRNEYPNNGSPGSMDIQIGKLTNNTISLDANTNIGINVHNLNSEAQTLPTSSISIGQQGGFFGNSISNPSGTVDIALENVSNNPIINIKVDSGGQGLSAANNGAIVDQSGPNITITP